MSQRVFRLKPCNCKTDGTSVADPREGGRPVTVDAERTRILARLNRIREAEQDREPATDEAIAVGLSDREISDALGVAPSTVWRRRQRIAAGEV